MSTRIQLRRTPGWRKPAGAVVVTRSTRWGNPFTVEEYGRDDAIRLYREVYLAEYPELAEVARRELAGKTLACWCRLDLPCHADVLLRIAAGGAP